ncbi:MAG: nucleoside recognition domain-containing protein [Syntrophus sp. (in: bacteria)]
MENPEVQYGALVKTGLKMGVRKGWDGFIWMMQIVLPISLLTTLLDWSGWIGRLDFLLTPVMGILHLPPAAALPLLIGMLANIYGGIAAMVVLPLNEGQMTLIGIFLLMAHNLIQEGIIQGQSGINPVKATLFRIITASVTVMIVGPWLVSGPAATAVARALPPIHLPFADMLWHWLQTTTVLCFKIFLIIMFIMTLLETMRFLDWINYVVRFFSPLLKLMGLDAKVGLLWMTAIIFGLAYGGAVIVEEAKAEHLSKEDLEMLHLSIGINHSMVEDPPLFISVGLNAFWLYIPRIVVAVITVHLIRLWYRFRR